MKLSELLLELGNSKSVWKRSSLKEDDQLDLFADNKTYHVMINGKLWKRDGKPVEFNGFDSAEKAVIAIIDKYGKPAQVIDPERYPTNQSKK